MKENNTQFLRVDGVMQPWHMFVDAKVFAEETV